MFVWLDLHSKKLSTQDRRRLQGGTKGESDSCSVSERCHRFMARCGRGGVEDMIGRDGSSAPGSADSCLVGVSWGELFSNQWLVWHKHRVSKQWCWKVGVSHRGWVSHSLRLMILWSWPNMLDHTVNSKPHKQLLLEMIIGWKVHLTANFALAKGFAKWTPMCQEEAVSS